MLNAIHARTELLELLKEKSVFRGDFVLSSGARSSYYVDCRMTTTDARGAWLIGRVMLDLIRREAAARNVVLDSVGGLTLGADPITFAVGMTSVQETDGNPLQMFVVRKIPKTHGQTKLIEGNFKKGDRVVVVDDVITTGESSLKAIDAVQREGGKVEFVAVLVDRQEGGRERIEKAGIPVVAAFQRDELLKTPIGLDQPDPNVQMA